MKTNSRHKLMPLIACMIPLGSLAQALPTSPADPAIPPVMLSTTDLIASPSLPRHSVEIYTSRHRLTAGYADWSEIGLRGNYELGANLLQMELATMRRFSESGTYVGLGDTVTINPDWFATLSVGAGNGASYLPRYRVDGFINRKLLPKKNLVATLGMGYYSAPDGHADRTVSMGATYYFSEPWIVQGEIKFNTSKPGSVNTRQQFIAATWGRDKQTQITGRYAWGSEGYQSIGAGAALVDFRSHQTSLAVRQWVGNHWGLSASAERYKNPFYRRGGINVGFFWQFQ